MTEDERVADLAVRHDDLRVQSQPLSRTLLWGGGVTGGGVPCEAR